MDYWGSLVALIQSILTSSAILIGGIWAYFKFVQGRTHKPRIELDVACRIYTQTNGLARLHVTVVLKNVGISMVGIDTETSAIRIYNAAGTEYCTKARELEWDRVGTFTVFNKHRWIEPSEIIRDEKIVECNSSDPVFKVEAIIMSETHQWYSAAICRRA